MEKNYANLGVALDKGLEMTWIRHFKIDATKQLTKETFLRTWSSEIVLVISELKCEGLILTS